MKISVKQILFSNRKAISKQIDNDNNNIIIITRMGAYDPRKKIIIIARVNQGPKVNTLDWMGGVRWGNF